MPFGKIVFQNNAPHAVWENIVNFVTLRDKYTLSWNKKVCKISRKFTVGFFTPSCRVLFVVKFYNGMFVAIWKKNHLFCNTSILS